MVVLSLFDGISCGRLALQRAGISVEQYYASEIKKAAIKCSKQNHKDVIHVGDITKISYKDGVLHTENGDFGTRIDMVIGGSPCQDLSIANQFCGDRAGLQGSRSGLFYEYLRLLHEIEPRYFLLENVVMTADNLSKIESLLGVKGRLIDSALVSYQHRKRLYFANWNYTLPADKNIIFRPVHDGQEYEALIKLTPSRVKLIVRAKDLTDATKIRCLTAKQDRLPNSGVVWCDRGWRYLTRGEIEAAQTLPLGYCDCLSYRQMQDVCGNGWTVDVVSRIFSQIPLDKQ